MNASKTICFDLNKTLIKENAWLNLNLALGVTEQEDNILMDWGKRGIISDAAGQQIILNIYRNSGKHTKQTILQTLLNYNYLEGAQKVISELFSRGHKLLLISGSMDLLVEHVAYELGISTWYANNHFIFNENGYLSDIKTVANDYNAKVLQLTNYCTKNGISITDVYCVGDGDNDRELFKATGKGITFTGSKISENAWQTIEKLEDLLKIL